MSGKSNGGLSGSTLKLIALVTMLIDHIGSAILKPLMNQTAYFEMYDRFIGMNSEQLHQLYRLLRMIGRVSFPIFCFLLVEGFVYTKSRGKYAFRLLIFAGISEIPFDLAFLGSKVNWDYQNIFFTLLLGFLGMWTYEYLHGHWKDRGISSYIKWLAVPSFMGLATLLRTDYAWYGVGIIFVFFFFREHPKQRNLACIFSFLPSWPAMFSLIPIHFYNGRRGLGLKYIFYLFYPGHLFLLYEIYRRLLIFYAL